MLLQNRLLRVVTLGSFSESFRHERFVPEGFADATAHARGDHQGLASKISIFRTVNATSHVVFTSVAHRGTLQKFADVNFHMVLQSSSSYRRLRQFYSALNQVKFYIKFPKTVQLIRS